MYVIFATDGTSDVNEQFCISFFSFVRWYRWSQYLKFLNQNKKKIAHGIFFNGI